MSAETAQPKTSDTYAKTLALLRRLLVGNGYALEDVKIEEVEERDLHLPGRMILELQVIPTETRVPGLPKGNEAAVVKTREELAGYLANFHAQLGEDRSWVEDIRARLSKSPTKGWGAGQVDIELGKQTKRVSLVLPCDICRGMKHENCRLCFAQREINCTHCNGAREMWCQTCSGSGVNPQDRNSPCPHCRGKMKLVCTFCQGRGRVVCQQCRGTGQTQCIECLGHGFFNEETLLKVAAQGHFELGSLTATPKGVSAVLESLGEINMAKGHAVITPMPSRPDGPTAIEFDAILPYGRFNMKMKNDIHEVIAVGMKPVLFDFPPLLDDTLSHVPEQLNAGTLVPMGQKYRLIRELAEAMGKGEKPARFFAQRYPYGLTAPLAFSIATKLKQVFAHVSLQPRLITAVAATVLTVGAYYSWLTQPHPALPVKPAMVDGVLAMVLALLAWLAVAIAGHRALKRVMPMSVSLIAAGNLIAFITFIAVLAGCAGLLYLPATRPDWLELYLK